MISWKAKMTSLLKKTKKHVKLKNAYAQEVEKCENLTKELSIFMTLFQTLELRMLV
jgi:hypothetical protein